MLTSIAILIASAAVTFVVALAACKRAPVGYQDETGFHYDPKERPKSQTWVATPTPEKTYENAPRRFARR